MKDKSNLSKYSFDKKAVPGGEGSTGKYSASKKLGSATGSSGGVNRAPKYTMEKACGKTY